MDKSVEIGRFRLECECGACSLVAQHWPELINIPEEDVIYLSYHIDQWYAEKGIFEMIWSRIKLAWKILVNGQYFLFEIGIRQHQLKDFRDYINKIILETQLSGGYNEKS